MVKSATKERWTSWPSSNYGWTESCVSDVEKSIFRWLAGICMRACMRSHSWARCLVSLGNGFCCYASSWAQIQDIGTHKRSGRRCRRRRRRILRGWNKLTKITLAFRVNGVECQALIEDLLYTGVGFVTEYVVERIAVNHTSTRRPQMGRVLLYGWPSKFCGMKFGMDCVIMLNASWQVICF